MTKWETFKKYINSKEIGSVITRKSLAHAIFNGPHPPTSSYGSTIDNYRNALVRLGILDHIERGKYKICYHIRNNVTSSELKRTAYGGYRRWFNDIKVEGETK